MTQEELIEGIAEGFYRFTHSKGKEDMWQDEPSIIKHYLSEADRFINEVLTPVGLVFMDKDQSSVSPNERVLVEKLRNNVIEWWMRSEFKCKKPAESRARLLESDSFDQLK